VQRFQKLSPHLGKGKITQILARTGLHLATTTVGRIRRNLTLASQRRRQLKPCSGPGASARPNGQITSGMSI
jgi:hypothetical protein